MTDDTQFTRRMLLRTSAVTVTGGGAIGTVSGLGGESVEGVDAEELDESAERVPLLDVVDRTRMVGSVPEPATGIRPGSQMFIRYPDGTTAGCTANFIWTDANGGGGPDGDDDSSPDAQGQPGDAGSSENGGGGNGSYYIGAAGHCFLPEDKNASKNAKRKEEDEEDVYDVSQLDVSVCDDCTFGGATGLIIVSGETIELGEIVYARQETPNGEQVGHDFGLVEIPAEAEDLIVPSLPEFGGPDGVSDEAIPAGLPMNQYGAGVVNGEVFPTMGSNGVSLGDAGTPESWYAGIRASPGDSGSPIQASEAGEGVEGGEAGGILTHLTTLGTAGTTMGRCKEMVREDIGLEVEVVQPGDL